MKKKSIAQPLSPHTTLLDLVSTYPATESVIRRYDAQAGECLLCTCLFESLEDVARTKNLDIQKLLQELHEVIVKRTGHGM